MEVHVTVLEIHRRLSICVDFHSDVWISTTPPQICGFHRGFGEYIDRTVTQMGKVPGVAPGAA